MSKRYYWLKLKKDFFEDKKIKILEKEKRGKEILLLYLKLLLAALETEGRLRYDEKRAFTPAQLAVVTKTPPKLTKQALELLQDIGFIQWEEDGTLFLPELSGMVGSEAESTERSRRCREKNKALQCNENATQSKSIEKETEKEIEIEIESEQELDEEEGGGAAVVVNRGEDPTAPAQDYHVKLTLDEQQLLMTRMGLPTLMNYLQKLEGYAVLHRKKIRDPYGTILKWYEEDE